MPEFLLFKGQAAYRAEGRHACDKGTECCRGERLRKRAAVPKETRCGKHRVVQLERTLRVLSQNQRCLAH
jgi:hypothetical protein